MFPGSGTRFESHLGHSVSAGQGPICPLIAHKSSFVAPLGAFCVLCSLPGSATGVWSGFFMVGSGSFYVTADWVAPTRTRAQPEGLARCEYTVPLGIDHCVPEGIRVGVERGKSGIPPSPQWCRSRSAAGWALAISTPDVKGEVPLAVGEVEQHRVGWRHGQVVFADQP